MQRSLFHWERDFRSQLVRLALPIALQSVFSALMQIVDNVMIGRLPGEVPFAAVSQADRITFFFQVALFGIISGASVFVAQYWGKRDVAGVRRTYGIAMFAGLIIGAMIGLPAIFAPRALMRLMTKSEEVVELGAQYLRIMGFVYFLQSQAQVRAAVLKSTEKVNLTMGAGISAIVVNAGLSYLLIFDHGWIGGYGARGGAYAMLIGVALELFLLEFFGRRNRYVIAAKLRELLPGSLENIRRFWGIALPVLANESLWAGGTVIYSAIYGRIGDGVTAPAAAGAFLTVDSVMGVAIRAMCHACGVMVGMKLGAGDLDGARTYARRFMFATPAITQIFSLLVVLPLANPIIRVLDIDATAAQMAREMIYIMVGFSWLHAINCTVIISLLRTGGDIRAAALIDVAPLWIFGVPFAAIAGLVLKWDIQHVYLATYAEQIGKTAMSIWRYRQGKWVRNIVKEA